MTVSKKKFLTIAGLVLAACLLLLCLFLLNPGSDPEPSGDPTGVPTEATGDTQPQETETQPVVVYPLTINGQQWEENTTQMALSDVDIAELTENLPLLPHVQKITLDGTLPEMDALQTLIDAYPEIEFYWQLEVCGVKADINTTELDLSNIPMETVAAVENALDYLPKLEKVIMCDCGISNEEMDALGQRNPDVRFVWTVALGPYVSLRTDATFFISPNESIWLNDEQAYNFRYCVDMVCLDLGHHPIGNCEFVRYMPNLKYLIIADCNISDLSPLMNHQSLIYLEAFINPITDYSPLLTCTNLQDLNICFTYGDMAPLLQMNWLKRLWWSPYRPEKFALKEALPNTEINYTTTGSTAGGWRTGELYYEMRDYLGMSYMTH